MDVDIKIVRESSCLSSLYQPGTHISNQHSHLHIFSYFFFSDTLVHFKTLPHLPQASSYSTYNNDFESIYTNL